MIAAIVGGGVNIPNVVEIPKILTVPLRWLLGLFGLSLALWTSGATLGIIFTAIILTGMTAAFIEANLNDQKYKRLSAEHASDPSKLIEDAKLAFYNTDYKWAIRLVAQAREASGDDSWQSGYAFLLGAQLALREKGSAQTKSEIMSCLSNAAENQAGYLSSPDHTRALRMDLAAVKSAIAGEENGKDSAVVIRAELETIIQAIG